MLKFIFAVFCLSIFLAFPKSALAYLDPGTGSFIIQIVLSAILGGIFAFKLFFAKIKRTIQKVFSKIKNNEQPDK